ncbi:MAG TPA: DinB family protein [Thermomicrobiales bacterium]|nr:DinB family protein [Thermomicrobiales bacterium]
MTSERAIRDQIVALLQGGNAHMTFDEAVADFPLSSINTRPPHVPYTPWHLLEHLRITQRDILDFIAAGQYEEPRWPDDYWPDQDVTANEQSWQETIRQFREDLTALIALAQDPAQDLGAPVKHATNDGQNLARELLVVADHNAYHIGEFAILRQVMGTWPADH